MREVVLRCARAWSTKEEIMVSAPRVRRAGFSSRVIPLSSINILPQHRMFFDEDDLRALAKSIWEDGLFSFPVVARLSHDQVEALLRVKNQLHHDNEPFALSDLVPSARDPSKFDVLIAGERRVRAIRALSSGEIARGSSRSLSPLARRLRRNTIKGMISVELAGGAWLTPDKFLTLQNKENSYVPPSTEEVAAGYRSWFDYQKLQHPKLTVGEFAEKVNRSPDTLKKYFSYLDVDPDVRARLKRLSARSAFARTTEYARLLRVQRKREERVVERERDRLCGLLSKDAEDALRGGLRERHTQFAQTLLAEVEARRYTARRIHKIVDAWSGEQTSLQLGLFSSLAGEEARVSGELRRVRERAIEAHFTWSLRAFREFVTSITGKFESGLLGLPSSPLVAPAVIRAMLELAEMLIILLSVARRHLENPAWNGKRRPGSVQRVIDTERALAEEERRLRDAVASSEEESS